MKRCWIGVVSVFCFLCCSLPSQYSSADVPRLIHYQGKLVTSTGAAVSGPIDLRARLYDRMLTEQQEKISSERRSMVSTGDRSAKIRTYNFPQSRVTDHRINLTLYKLDEIMTGNIDELIEALRRHDLEERLKLEATKV